MPQHSGISRFTPLSSPIPGRFPGVQEQASTQSFGDTPLGGLNLFNATGERGLPASGPSPFVQYDPRRLDPSSPFFEQPLSNAFSFLSLNDQSGLTLNQHIAGSGIEGFTGLNPGQSVGQPLSIRDPEAYERILGNLFTSMGIGPEAPEEPVDPLTQIMEDLIAAIGAGGGAAHEHEPAPLAPQQLDSAFSTSLIELIGGLFQAMLLSGQLGGGGAVGQPAAAPQVVFRSDLDRLGVNQF